MTDRIQDVNEAIVEELARVGLDPDRLGKSSTSAVAVLGHLLDTTLSALTLEQEAMRVIAAAFRAYSRVADQHADALDPVGASR